MAKKTPKKIKSKKIKHSDWDKMSPKEQREAIARAIGLIDKS